ncbi:MAG: hypothetical protein GY845_18680 [Planctomycetes bacterium]|nr:hypothetical protein [Planctomycetota bacterium]
MLDIINPSLETDVVQPDSVDSGAGLTNPPLDEIKDVESGFGEPSSEIVNPPLDSASVSLESAGDGVVNPPLDEPDGASPELGNPPLDEPDGAGPE